MRADERAHWLPLRRAMSSIEQIEKERLGGARLGQQKWEAQSGKCAPIRTTKKRKGEKAEKKEKGKGTRADGTAALSLARVWIHAPREAISKEPVMPAPGTLRPSIHAHSTPDNFQKERPGHGENSVALTVNCPTEGANVSDTVQNCWGANGSRDNWRRQGQRERNGRNQISPRDANFN